MARHIASLVGSIHEAEDLTQETLLRYWRARVNFRGGNFPAYLYAIAHNLVATWFRERGVARRTAVAVAAITCEGAPSHDPLVRVRIDEALTRLPADQQIVLYLHCVRGIPYEDIARVLDLPRATVGTRIHRGRTTLRNSHTLH